MFRILLPLEMSHFSSVKTTLSHRESLLAGLQTILETIGITPSIESHDSPVDLINAYDRNNQQQAEIIIRRQHLQGLLDLGFRWNAEQNCYSAVIDAWDFSRNLLGKHFETVENFLEELQIAHNTAFINILYPEDLWSRETVTAEDGTITTTLTQKTDVYA
ncbi:DUF1257 domain-containing protein [Microseira wollei]|uniref:Uncharacterized protein n=1 Tax=Microseira wollei NIES-4236 TaxID=2530354 RepID=A0AAV3X6H5_9CYAN|nr:DUF1257 domain-containing protein [Microseira wollei]GET37714.1 hypothetical protein MiSe_24680 [Microseira wollei NIES-4236]